MSAVGSLLEIAELAEGLSGRALRKLPFQAHAFYVQVRIDRYNFRACSVRFESLGDSFQLVPQKKHDDALRLLPFPRHVRVDGIHTIEHMCLDAMVAYKRPNTTPWLAGFALRLADSLLESKDSDQNPAISCWFVHKAVMF